MLFVDCSGWISAFEAITVNKAVGAIMIIVAILFTICAVLSVILLKMVRVYSLFFLTFTCEWEFSFSVLTYMFGI